MPGGRRPPSTRPRCNNHRRGASSLSLRRSMLHHTCRSHCVSIRLAIPPKHVSERLQASHCQVTARTNELEALVRQATKTVGSSSKRGGPIVRPLQMLRLKGEDVHCIIMKRAAVAAQPGTMGRSSLEAPYA